MEIESNRKKIEMWNFIRQNRNCLIDVNDELKCSFCKNVLINAQQSECSCTFCRECLLEHLKNSNRCLGINCIVYEINIDTNVNEDIRKNSQIRRLKCKCPTLNCNNEMCIEDLIEHFKSCSVKKCPFVSIGCNFEESRQLNVENHISTSSLNHNKLIIDFVNNLENKITILQSNYRNVEDENKTLRDDVNEFQNIKDEIEIIKQNHHEDIERVRGENYEFVDVIKHEFEMKIQEVESKLELDKIEIEQLKKENCDNVEIIKKMENDKKCLRTQLENLKKESDCKIKKLDNKVEMLKKKSEDKSMKFENEIEKLKKESEDKSKILENEIEKLKKESEDKSKKFENEIVKLKKESEDKSKKFETEIEKLKKESEDKSKKFENQVGELRKKFITNANKTEERFKKENEKIKIDHKEFEQKLNKYENEIKNKEQSIQEIEKTLKDKCDVKLLNDIKNEIRQSPISIYVWRLDDIIQKREDAKRDKSQEILFSDPFFTKKSGYKLRLRIYPNGWDEGLNTHLGLALQIMKSGHDEILTWPCTEVVKFSLINTKSKSSHASFTFSLKETVESKRFVFDQPTKEFNAGRGQPQFVSWTDLLDDTKNLIKDSSIYIKVDLEN